MEVSFVQVLLYLLVNRDEHDDDPYAPQLTNQLRDDGEIMPFAILPFADGSDPTGVAVYILPSGRLS
jgi:hypothetical protein